MKRIITLRAHGNAYGPVWQRGEGGGLDLRAGDCYNKQPGDIYDHPDPDQLIADKVVARPAPLDHDGDGRPGGSAPGENATARRKR